jgi:hypothetical protein
MRVSGVSGMYSGIKFYCCSWVEYKFARKKGVPNKEIEESR